MPLLLMVGILVGLFLIIVLVVISKSLGREYINILIGHSRGMKEVDEGFLVLIKSLREVVEGVCEDALPSGLEVRVHLGLEPEGGDRQDLLGQGLLDQDGGLGIEEPLENLR